MTTANIFGFQDTWNDVSTTFNAINVDVTDTASDAASKLIKLEVGGTTQFSVQKDGAVVAQSSVTADGFVSSGNIDAQGNQLILDADNDTYIVASTDDRLQIFVGGSEVARFDANATDTFSLDGVGFSPTGAVVGQALGYPNSTTTLEPYTPAGGGDLLAAANETVTGDYEFQGAVLFTQQGRYDVDYYADIAAAVSAIGSTDAVLYINSPLALSGNLTIPSTLDLEFGPSGRIQLETYDLTISGNIISPVDQKLFNINDTGRVSGLSYAYPEWFGAQRNGSSDDSEEFGWAEESLSNNGVLRLSEGSYGWDGALSTTKGIHIIGEGSNATKIIFQGTSSAFVTFADGGARGGAVRGIRFSTTQNCTSGTVISIEDATSGSQDLFIDDINFRNGNSIYRFLYAAPDTQRIYCQNIIGANFDTAFDIDNANNSVWRNISLDGNGSGTALRLTGNRSAAEGGVGSGGCNTHFFSDWVVANVDDGAVLSGFSSTFREGCFDITMKSCNWDDTKSNYGLRMSGVGASRFIDQYCVSNSSGGILIEDCQDIDIIGPHANKNEGHGITIDGASSDIRITGGTATDNNDGLTSGQTGTNDGIHIASGSTASNIKIVSVDCGGERLYEKPQRFPVNIAATGSDNIVVVGVSGSGCTGSEQVQNSSTGEVHLFGNTPSGQMLVSSNFFKPARFERLDAPAFIEPNFGGGDSAWYHEVNDGGASWIQGIDDGDGDKWKLSYGAAGSATFGTNDYLSVDPSTGDATFSGNVDAPDVEGTSHITAPRYRGQKITVADDDFATLSFGEAICGYLFVANAGADARSGFFFVDTYGGSATCTAINAGANMDTGTDTVPTGTTGVDGQITVYAHASNNAIYVENRKGDSNTWSVILLGLGDGD